MGQDIFLDVGVQLDIPVLSALCQKESRLRVSQSLVERLTQRRHIVESYINTPNQSVYGVTTGVGAMKTYQIPSDEIMAFNKRLVRDHAAGLGEPLDPETSRLMMAIRLIELTQGGSGISPETFAFLLSCYNHAIIPVVPQLGSVGEADITILAHMARMVIGEGKVWNGNKHESTRAVLNRHGLVPITLKARDGLSLIGGNSYTMALAGRTLSRWLDIRRVSLAAVALSWIAWRANLSALRQDVLTAAGPETALVGNEVGRWLIDTSITPRDIQDPLSWRCVPHLYAAMDKVEKQMKEQLIHDIHAARDNPLVLEKGDVVSNGNFDITMLAISLDAARSAIFRVMALLSQRVAKLLTHHYSGLTPGLAHTYGDAGLGLLEFNVSALMAEAEMLARGPLIQMGTVAEGVEDYGGLAPVAARRLTELMNYWEMGIATELVCAVQGIEIQTLPVGPTMRPIVDGIKKLESSDGLASPYDRVLHVQEWMMSDSGLEVFSF